MNENSKQLYVLAFDSENYDWFYSRTHANLHQEQAVLENPDASPMRFKLTVPATADNELIREQIIRVINKIQEEQQEPTAISGDTPNALRQAELA